MANVNPPERNALYTVSEAEQVRALNAPRPIMDTAEPSQTADPIPSNQPKLLNIKGQKTNRKHVLGGYADLRKLQRLMMSVAEHDEKGMAQAAAARVWKDLEVLRRVMKGKPVTLEAGMLKNKEKTVRAANLILLSSERSDKDQPSASEPTKASQS